MFFWDRLTGAQQTRRWPHRWTEGHADCRGRPQNLNEADGAKGTGEGAPQGATQCQQAQQKQKDEETPAT
jgi:hypothetical protein